MDTQALLALADKWEQEAEKQSLSEWDDGYSAAYRNSAEDLRELINNYDNSSS